MLIKLTPPPSAGTPTILFHIAFPELPQNLPLPQAWATQLARLVADDLETPPAMHALDRAAALPSLLREVLFDLPRSRVVCTFLDGAVEEWALPPACAEMLARVIGDVEESGRADEHARAVKRAQEQEREREQAADCARKEQEREAELGREYEEKMRKTKEQSLNSPPASLKGSRCPRRSRSLLKSLVATFSSTSSSSSISASATSTPTSPTLCSNTSRSPSPLRAFARRASFSSLPSFTRRESTSAASSPSAAEPRETESPPVSPPPHNLETPPNSAPPTPPSSAFTEQQREVPPSSAISSTTSDPRGELTARLLRRRARSRLVDAFRAHVLPQLGARVGLFEPGSSSLLRVYSEDSQSAASAERSRPTAPGGGYHAWVTRSMLRRAQNRMHELEGVWPALSSPVRSRHSKSASADSASPRSVDFIPHSPKSISFPASPTSPRHATFEPWSSSDEGDSSDDTASECDMVDGDSDSDGSSVHTPESGHSIGYVPSYVDAKYLKCSDASEAEQEKSDTLPLLTPSHIRRSAQTSPGHSREVSGASHTRRRTSSSPNSAAKCAKKEQRELKRAGKAEHAAFVRMTARLRIVLAQSVATRQLVAMQKDEADRVREGRGLRRAWLDRRTGVKPAEMVQVFRPSGLGRSTWGAADVVEADADVVQPQLEDRPPAYENVVVQAPAVRRSRPSPPIHFALAHLDNLELDDELEHLERNADELEGLDIEVDLERLDLAETLEVEDMGFDDGGMGLGGGIDLFAGVGSKARGKARRVPVARREGWERRRTVAI